MVKTAEQLIAQALQRKMGASAADAATIARDVVARQVIHSICERDQTKNSLQVCK